MSPRSRSDNTLSKEVEYNRDGDLWIIRHYDSAGDVGVITEFCDEEGDQMFWVFGDVPRMGYPWVITAYETGINRGKQLGAYEKALEIQRVLEIKE